MSTPDQITLFCVSSSHSCLPVGRVFRLEDGPLNLRRDAADYDADAVIGVAVAVVPLINEEESEPSRSVNKRLRVFAPPADKCRLRPCMVGCCMGFRQHFKE